MAAREIHDVDVVAHAGAVGRRIIVAPDAQRGLLADRDLRDVREEIVRNAARVLADRSRGMRADRIEVAQRHVTKIPTSGGAVGEDVLDHQLGLAVRIGRPQRMIFCERQALGIAVDRGRGAEDDAAHILAVHRLQKRDAAAHVVVVIVKRPLDRFTDRLQAGEMHHGLRLIGRHDALKRWAIAQVELMEGDARVRRECADAIEDLRLRVHQVVDAPQATARRREHDAGVRPDVAEAAGDEDRAGYADTVSFLSGMCASHFSTSAGSENSVSSSARASSSVCSTDSMTPRCSPERSVANSRRMPKGSNTYADQNRPPSGTGPMTSTRQPRTRSISWSKCSGATWKATCCMPPTWSRFCRGSPFGYSKIAKSESFPMSKK